MRRLVNPFEDQVSWPVPVGFRMGDNFWCAQRVGIAQQFQAMRFRLEEMRGRISIGLHKIALSPDFPACYIVECPAKMLNGGGFGADGFADNFLRDI